MKRKFFVYSLPRSGSSWLSQFFSMPGAYCYHEPLADGSCEALVDRMLIRPEECVGAIDTTAHENASFKLEECQYYVIERNIQEISSSLRLKGWILDIGATSRKLKDVARSRGAITLHYKWFNDLGYLRNVWLSVVGTPFDEERAEYLMEMNIQRTFASVKRRFKKCTSG